VKRLRDFGLVLARELLSVLWAVLTVLVIRLERRSLSSLDHIQSQFALWRFLRSRISYYILGPGILVLIMSLSPERGPYDVISRALCVEGRVDSGDGDEE
jgi:hypothetical protein